MPDLFCPLGLITGKYIQCLTDRCKLWSNDSDPPECIITISLISLGQVSQLQTKSFLEDTELNDTIEKREVGHNYV